MKVLVTGGTEFVGSHRVHALLDVGHEVRMLVRAPERIAPALDPLGVQAPEHAVGDVTDAETVRRALKGCDAVLHAANVFLFDARDVARMQEDNRRGTEVVLTTAQSWGWTRSSTCQASSRCCRPTGHCGRTLRSASRTPYARAPRSRRSASRETFSGPARRS